MAYPRRLLSEGEEIALDLRPHWWFFSKDVLTGVPLFVVAVLVLTQTHGDVRNWSMALWGVVAIAWAVWLGYHYLKWVNTQFVVTSKRVIYRTGVLSKRGVEIPLERVNNINFNQRLFERVIGAGDLEIESAGESGLSKFTDVNHPDSVAQEINRQRERNARERASWSGGGRVERSEPAPDERAQGSVAERLRDLESLRDQGLVTEEEYAAKRAQLLAEM